MNIENTHDLMRPMARGWQICKYWANLMKRGVLAHGWKCFDWLLANGTVKSHAHT